MKNALKTPKRIAKKIWSYCKPNSPGDMANSWSATANLPDGWPEIQATTAEELQNQRQWASLAGYRPTITLILPLSAHNSALFQQTLNSVQQQSYPNWQLTILYNEADCDDDVLAAIHELESDSRLSAIKTPNPIKPDQSLNLGLKNAEGGYCALVNEGDELTPDALFHVVYTLEHYPETDFVYTDEVHVRPGAKRVDAIHLKPNWSPELLMAYNYIGSLAVFRCEFLNQVGGYRTECDGAQEWDVLLRLLDQEHYNIKRVPRCCYIRKTEAGPVPYHAYQATASGTFAKTLERFVSGKKLSATVETTSNGTGRICWNHSKEPRVSIVIPNKNSLDLIRNLVNDLEGRTTYSNKEIIIVDNESTDPRVHDFYREKSTIGQIQVVPFNEPFNYSAACNRGAAVASGDYLVFLNNDIEVVSSDWLEELIGWASQPEVGVVGPKLVFPNGQIQHCGMMVGVNFVSHIWLDSKPSSWQLFGTPNSYRNVLSVTGACQAVSKNLFDEVGGYDETYQLAFSDVSFCLHCSQKGYRTVYTPFAELIHFEGATRSKQTPIQDINRFAAELRTFRISEDPYLNPALHPGLTTPTLRKLGDPTQEFCLGYDIDCWNVPTGKCKTLDFNKLREMISPPVPSPIIKTPLEAAKLAVYVLCHYELIRKKFPLALSEGPSGKFCSWLCTEGIKQFRLAKESVKFIREAFTSNPASGIRQLLAEEYDVRRSIPHACLPTGRHEFLCWLLTTGKSSCGFLDVEIWWLMLELIEDPVAGFEFTYRISTEWHGSFPDGIVPENHDELISWAKEQFHLDEPYVEQIRQRWAAPVRSAS